MRVLVISPVFPPVADSEAFCGGKFVLALRRAGIEAAVVACPMPDRAPDDSACWRALAELTRTVPNPPRAPWLRQACLGLQYRTTAYITWTRAVVEAAQAQHRTRPFDLVLSRALPWWAHLAGFWISRTLRRPWMANFNDPWDLRPFIAERARANTWNVGWNVRRWMARTLASADALTFPCERLRDYCLRGSRPGGVTAVVPHIGDAARKSPAPRAEFKLVHAGKLGMGELTARPTDALLQGLAGLLQHRPAARAATRLVFVGREDEDTMAHASRLGLGPLVSWVGPVSYERSLDWIEQASVTLLVEGDFPEGIFLPSKLCDYLVARKPVLALSPAAGTANDFSRVGGVVRANSNDPTAVTQALLQHFDAFADGHLAKHAPPESLARQFESAAVADRFLAVVEPLIAPRPGPGASRAPNPASRASRANERPVDSLWR